MKDINWKTVFSLASGQALFQTATVLVSTLSGLVGLMLAPDKSYATLPIAVISIGTASMMIPAALLMKRFGKKVGFLTGISIGFLTGLLAALAIFINSFWLFVFANLMIGWYQAFSQYYRFAAAEVVPEKYKGKAISWVIAAGVVAAIAGPNIAKFTKDLGEWPFIYSYLSISGLSICSFIIISRIKLISIVATSTIEDKVERPLSAIMQQPVFITAILTSAIGYSVMIMVMTATPIAMHLCGHTTDESATVIQWHVLGMFVPSFFTGYLIQRFGVTPLIISGATILLIHVSLAVTGTDFLHFVSGLILLGIGWNFMFIGGTTLLTKAYTLGEQSKTQAAHDFIVFGIISVSSFAAGSILNNWGWSAVNLTVIPLILVALMVNIMYRLSRPTKLKVQETLGR